MMLVNIGERYWIVIADASGMCCSVTKNRNNAVVPKMPRSRSIVRFDPRQSAFTRYRPMKQSIVASEQRKNTTSTAGICETCFTKTFANEKASVDRNIARTPSVRNARSLLKPVMRIIFLKCRRNRSLRRSRALP